MTPAAPQVTALARLVYIDAPTGETECAFWRRHAGERSLTIRNLRAEVDDLRATIAELEEELEEQAEALMRARLKR